MESINGWPEHRENRDDTDSEAPAAAEQGVIFTRSRAEAASLFSGILSQQAEAHSRSSEIADDDDDDEEAESEQPTRTARGIVHVVQAAEEHHDQPEAEGEPLEQINHHVDHVEGIEVDEYEPVAAEATEQPDLTLHAEHVEYAPELPADEEPTFTTDPLGARQSIVPAEAGGYAAAEAVATHPYVVSNEYNLTHDGEAPYQPVAPPLPPRRPPVPPRPPVVPVGPVGPAGGGGLPPRGFNQLPPAPLTPDANEHLSSWPVAPVEAAAVVNGARAVEADRDVHPFMDRFQQSIGFGSNRLPMQSHAEAITTERRGVSAPAVVAIAGAAYLFGRRHGRKKEAARAAVELQKQQEHQATQHTEVLRQQRQEAEVRERRQEERIQDMQESQQRQERRFNSLSSTPLTAPEQQPQVSFQRIEQTPLPPIAVAPEQQRAAASQEQQRLVAVEQEVLEQQAHEQQEQTREWQDAWLRHRTDGRGRERSDLEPRGEAYHQERRAETNAARTDDNSTTNQTAGPGMSGSFYAMPTHTDPGVGGLPSITPGMPSGMTSPALPSGPAQQADPQHQLPANAPKRSEPITSNVTNPWFWLMLALIVAAFFTAALLG